MGGGCLGRVPLTAPPRAKENAQITQSNVIFSPKDINQNSIGSDFSTPARSRLRLGNPFQQINDQSFQQIELVCADAWRSVGRPRVRGGRSDAQCVQWLADQRILDFSETKRHGSDAIGGESRRTYTAGSQRNY